MRNIDLEVSRDSYRDTLNSALHCMTEMVKAYEKRDKWQIARIKELERKEALNKDLTKENK